MAPPAKKDLSQKRVVDAIRPAAARYKVWDTKLTGFGLDVRPTGGRTWLLNYRFLGQQRRLILGSADRMAPAAARTAAEVALGQIGQGIDPLATRQGAVDGVRANRTERAQRATVADVAGRYFTSLRVAASSKWASEAERIYKRHIEPVLGARHVRDVEIKDVRALHEGMADTPVYANRMKAVVSAIISRAIADGERPRELLNPAGAVENYLETERDRYLSDDEWVAMAKAIKTLRTELRDAPEWDTRLHQLDALILLALTGARLRSVLPRQWADVDWNEHALTVTPAHKGVSRVLLGASAEAHLRACFDARGAGGGFIFPGQQRRLGTRTGRYERDTRPERAPSSVSSLRPMWNRLSELAEIDDFTFHDWRRSFATVAGDVGISDHMIGGLLGHRVPGIRRRYARRTDDALLAAATTVSAEVAKRLGLTLKGARSAVPFPLKRQRGAKR